ncbi:MAG: hypothetical protein Kow0069_19070 [Promethearchaeota archaeon]
MNSGLKHLKAVLKVPVSASNVVYHELIGLPVVVRPKPSPKKLPKNRDAASGPRWGPGGVVVDETKHLLLVETGDEVVKKYLKKACTFRFTLPDGTRVDVDGEKLVGRPEGRLKKIRKKRWN